MQRRKYLVGMGSLAAGGVAAIGSGAFNSVSANRSVSVEVAEDADAFLGLIDDSPYANTTANNTLELTIDSDANVQGEGINANATTSILQVFDVRNQGTQEVAISIDSTDLNNALTGGSNAQLHFYVGFEGGPSLDTYDPNDLVGGVGGGGSLDSSTQDRVLDTGQSMNVGLYVVNDDGTDWDVEEDITINAYSESTLLNNDV